MMPPAEDIYEVYAIRYATIGRAPGQNFLMGDPHEASSNLDYFVWLVKSERRIFVVDTGFSAKGAAHRGRIHLLQPADVLKRMGVEAAEVEDVIITHLHYDHVGGFEQFGRARFHLQDEEMSYATGRFMRHAIFRHAYEVDEIVQMVRHVYEGRVQFHDGDAELAPGLSVHRVGGHTKGMQCVRVHTRVGWIVLASDAAHLYANMEEERPFPVVFDVGEMVTGWQRLRSLADEPGFIVPGHDPLVMKRYAAPSAALQGTVVRLDDKPRDIAPSS
jgi:glyoxylase-like metal-dependent hydrolase (beta-lactamase superfamily II)